MSLTAIFYRRAFGDNAAECNASDAAGFLQIAVFLGFPCIVPAFGLREAASSSSLWLVRFFREVVTFPPFALPCFISLSLSTPSKKYFQAGYGSLTAHCMEILSGLLAYRTSSKLTPLAMMSIA